MIRGVPVTRTDRLLARVGLVFVGAVVVFVSAVLLLSSHVPDAQDRLSPRERAIAGPVLNSALVCGNTFGRVTEVVLDDPRDPHTIRYGCAWTILGIGKSEHTANCIEGRWEYPGPYDLQHSGRC